MRAEAHLGAQRSLPLDDVSRDVFGERLDHECLVDDDSLDRLLEQLGETGHVHAFLDAARSTVQSISAETTCSKRPQRR